MGIDGGGTKTVVQIADLCGNVIIENESGSSNYKGVGIESTKVNINSAILGAIRKLEISQRIVFKSACFGISGCDSDEDVEIYKKIIFGSKLRNYLSPSKAIIFNDTKIGLAAVSDSPNGIIIICGTGSNCYGVNEKGKEAKANGWDYILGDEGSRTRDQRDNNSISRAYYLKKISEGKTKKEAITCLTRRLCDVIYAIMRDGSIYSFSKVKSVRNNCEILETAAV